MNYCGDLPDGGHDDLGAGIAADQASLWDDHGDQYGHGRIRLAGRARRNADAVRNSPALKGLTIPRTGQALTQARSSRKRW
jgi:hypothetical protein